MGGPTAITACLLSFQQSFPPLRAMAECVCLNCSSQEKTEECIASGALPDRLCRRAARVKIPLDLTILTAACRRLCGYSFRRICHCLPCNPPVLPLWIRRTRQHHSPPTWLTVSGLGYVRVFWPKIVHSPLDALPGGPLAEMALSGVLLALVRRRIDEHFCVSEAYRNADG